MSIEDDVALLERVPTFASVGEYGIAHVGDRLRTARFRRGDTLFNAGDVADASYIVSAVHSGSRMAAAPRIVVGPGALIGELALIVAMKRPSTATALERSSAIRVARSLFQRVLENDPAAARRLRDELANRTASSPAIC